MQKNKILQELNKKWHKKCECDLKKTATKAVFGYGNPNADIVFIGEAPGKNEDNKGKPFVGASGKILTEMLSMIGLKREDVYITNIVKYRPLENRDPTPKEKEDCKEWLSEELNVINPKMIVLLGRHSLNTFFSEYNISKVRGRVFKKTFLNLNTKYFYPIYHPSATIYNRSLLIDLKKDFKKIPKILEKIKKEKMNIKKKTQIVILAGGRGKRMKSHLPKAIVPLKGRPMLHHLVDISAKIGIPKPIIIVGHKAEKVKKEIGKNNNFVLQKESLGTAHAVLCAKQKCKTYDTIVVLSSDQPNVRPESILESIAQHDKLKSKITLTTTLVPNFKDWRQYFLVHGRILRKGNNIVGIKEYKDADEIERKIKEVNTGCCYVFDAKWLWQNLNKVKNKNVQKEYYLTDLVKIANDQKEKIGNYKIDNREALGANSKEELEVLEKFVV
ncbi:MAG: NTP transferase domain-containing protein [Candidatus Pacebacteria bacterium]|nr:NTP transferase domain-containing protein [Candidatus Paceibacterota bacterium]MCF7863018.1 NTP transferase domain-containing protein [Candidatus Paceibacterota bacterium]